MRTAPSLDTLSRLLLDVGEAGHAAAVDEVVGAALQALRPALGFRFGWCGLVAEDAPAAPVMHCVGGIELPPGFVREFRAVTPRDDWGRGVVAHSGQVHRWSGFEETDEVVDAFVRRHDMFHGMAQHLRGAFGGRDLAIAVYRERGAPAFTDADADLLRLTARHVGGLWWHRMRDALAGDDATRVALVGEGGALVYAGTQVCRLLDRCDDAWDGTQLAPALVAGLRAPGGLRLGGARVGVARVSVARARGLVRLTLDAGEAPLSPREWRAARLYADGRSYKEAARALGLAPATVRSYLQSAYARLGVANKVALGRALDALGTPPA